MAGNAFICSLTPFRGLMKLVATLVVQLVHSDGGSAFQPIVSALIYSGDAL